MKTLGRNERWFLGLPLAATIVCLGAGSAQALPVVLSLDPRAAYMNTDSVDIDLGAQNASPIDLGALGISAGDLIRLEQQGDFRLGVSYGDDATSLGGVFSSSNVLAPSSFGAPNRVQGAIDAGTDFVTAPTWFFAWPTDIPEDFLIDDVTIQVPDGATHLFVAALDVAFWDNSDPDGDYAVQISRVPEPSSLLLLGSGLAGFALLRGQLRKLKG